MELKWVGALLSVLGCTAVGFQTAGQYSRETRYLQGMLRLLDFFRGELRYRSPQLPELVESGGKLSGGFYERFLCRYGVLLADQAAPDAFLCMQMCLQEMSPPFSSVSRILSLLGQNFTVFDLEGQLKGFESLKELTTHLLEEKQQDLPQHLRSYRILGLCAGTAVAILFL